MPVCKQCSNEFENRKEIDGKIRNLKNRKFCLICSPFNLHNTSKILDLEERKRIRRRNRVIAVQKRRRKIKEMAVKYLGGKCKICGYDKCFTSMSFHHLDSETKEFGIAEKGHTKSWETIRKELDKCILICSNCHGEIHEGLIDVKDLSP